MLVERTVYCVSPFPFIFRLAAFIAVALLWQGANAESSFELRLSTKNIASKDVGAVLNYLEEVQDKLPRQIISAINRPIKVKFSSFGNKRSDNLPVPTCSGQKKNVRYAYVIGSTIRVNERLLVDIIRGPKNSRTYPCKHGSMYKKVVAVLLHEIGHIYDKSDYRSAEERYGLRNCQSPKSTRSQDSENSKFDKKHCDRVKARFRRQRVISGDRPFIRLANWKRSFFGLGPLAAKDKIYERSVDQNELKNISEYFAVNLEYFLLDADFKCRLPTLYHYYSTHFNHEPFGHYGCSVNTKVFLSTPKMRIIDLNPDRIYRVNYLLADNGRRLESRWGHSLVHLVICAPERTEVGPDCERDTSHHVVLSFLANVDDFQLNYFKGVFGGYGSQPFLLPFSNVQTDYNYKQLRSLSSHSLDLSSAEKQLIVYRILELYWTYLGSYRFFTNSCAIEIRGLFQSALWNAPILYSHAFTPKTVLKRLKSSRGRNEVIGYPAYTDRFIRNYFYVYPDKFISGLVDRPKKKKRVVKKILKDLAKLDPGEFLERFNEATTGQFLQPKFLDQDPGQLPLDALTRAVQDIEYRFNTVSAYRFLALYAHMQLKANVDGAKANVVSRFTKSKSNQLGKKFHEYREAFEKVLPYYLPKGGYGIPLTKEMPANSKITELEQRKVRLNGEVYELINNHRKMKRERIKRKAKRLNNLKKVTNEIGNRMNELRMLKNKILPVFVGKYLKEMLQDPGNANKLRAQMDALRWYGDQENYVALKEAADEIYSRLNEHLGISAVNSTYVNPWGLIKIAAELDETRDI